MPLYEYKCKECGRHTEKRQKFSDPEITQCPSCGGLLERVISAPAIAFKGSGWYKDLYSSPKAAAPNSSNGEATSASTSSSEGAAPASAPTPSAPAAPAAPAPSSSPTSTTKASA